MWITFLTLSLFHSSTICLPWKLQYRIPHKIWCEYKPKKIIMYIVHIYYKFVWNCAYNSCLLDFFGWLMLLLFRLLFLDSYGIWPIRWLSMTESNYLNKIYQKFIQPIAPLNIQRAILPVWPLYSNYDVALAIIYFTHTYHRHSLWSCRGSVFGSNLKRFQLVSR